MLAVRLITTIKRFVGTAAEIAAFDLTDIPTGSEFIESDTGKRKILNAAGTLTNISVVNVAAGTNVIGKVGINGEAIIAAGKKTDAAVADKSITTAGFNTVSIINDGPAELVVAIDESSVTGAKKIYIQDSEAFADNISGTVLHYSIANDSCTFRYVLR